MKIILSSFIITYLIFAAKSRHIKPRLNQRVNLYESNERYYDFAQNRKYESMDKEERILFKTLLNLWHDPEFLALHNLQKETVLDSFRIFARRRGIESKRVLNLIKMMKETFSLNF